MNEIYDWMERHAELTAYVTVAISLAVGYVVWFGWPF